MTRDDILALRPASGDAASYRAALVKASDLLEQQRKLAKEREAFRLSAILTADDRAPTTAEKDAAAARLAVDRLVQLMPLIEGDLAAAVARETVERLRSQVGGIIKAIAAYQTWIEQKYPAIANLIGESFRLEDTARQSFASYLADVDNSYRSQAVRDLGELGVTLPVMSARKAFRDWQ